MINFVQSLFNESLESVFKFTHCLVPKHFTAWCFAGKAPSSSRQNKKLPKMFHIRTQQKLRWLEEKMNFFKQEGKK